MDTFIVIEESVQVFINLILECSLTCKTCIGKNN